MYVEDVSANPAEEEANARSLEPISIPAVVVSMEGEHPGRVNPTSTALAPGDSEGRIEGATEEDGDEV